MQGAINQLNGQVSSTQAELDKTFVLNFGKKGELKDEIKSLKKDAAAKSKELNKLLSAQDKATGACRTTHAIGIPALSVDDEIVPHSSLIIVASPAP